MSLRLRAGSLPPAGRLHRDARPPPGTRPVAADEPPPVEELLSVAVAALGGSERPGQVKMAQAVRHAIEAGEHLAVQAGTGTGKSLAYLVPAIRHAVATGTRGRLDRDDRAAAPAHRPRPAPPRRGARAAAAARAEVRDPQGPPQLPVPVQGCSAGWPEDDRRTQLFDPRAVSATGRHGAAHPRVGGRDRDRRPRRARARRERAGVAAGLGERPGVPGRARAARTATECFAELARAARRGGRRRRHQPRAARHRRDGGASPSCPSTTWSSSTRRTSWSTGSPRW